MPVVTLIAARHGAGLPEHLARDIAARLGGDVAWLEDGIACDIRPSGRPGSDALAEVRNLCHASAIDCVVQEAEGRRKGILIADMDSTMIGEECIDELADVVGIKDAVSTITARAMNGEIAFEPALEERVALLKGLPESVIAEVIATRISLASGGRTLVATMRANGAYAALVSGGFTAFTGAVAEKLGFDENRANRLHIVDGRLTGTVGRPILGREAKVEALREIAAMRGVTPTDAIAVAAEAPHRIDHGDLTALLFLQGYTAADFVT